MAVTLINQRTLDEWERAIGTLQHSVNCHGIDKLSDCTCGLAWRIRMTAILSDIRTLREALPKYGDHQRNCLLFVPHAVRRSDISYDHCDCGFEDLKNSLAS